MIGLADAVKGQVPAVFVTLREHTLDAGARLDVSTSVIQVVEKKLGAISRPAKAYIVEALPKTRSGKLLRRLLKALAHGEDPGDLSTLDNPVALEDIKRVLGIA